jgi:CubicO group peptidase (beta-lactamase class C family)
MTKLVVSVACLQLAERGLVKFDDPALIEKHCPELVAMPILEGFDDNNKPITRPRTKPLTLRRLLTHTSGLAYGFDPVQARWDKATGAPVWGAHATVEAFTTPLHFEPGTKYNYSTGIDWAGILVWRVTGKTLEEYFNENIWKPCGITGMSFYPTEDIKKHLMGMTGRYQGKLVPYPGPRDLQKLNPEDIGVLAGGAGLLGTVKGYVTFLQHILKCKDQPGLITVSCSDHLLS